MSRYRLKMEDSVPFFIGHHETKRPLPVTSEHIQQAHAANYDMLTCPITTSHFHSRVLSLLSTSLNQARSDSGHIQSVSPSIEQLTPDDTPLTPDASISQLIGVTSSWIDLCSPDPIIADISRQVLRLELSYAAFCGITYVMVPGPRHDAGKFVSQYARAILDGLSQGPYMQLHIWVDMVPNTSAEDKIGDLRSFARSQYTSNIKASTVDSFGSWELWDSVRSMCKYSTRLCLGQYSIEQRLCHKRISLAAALAIPSELPSESIQSRWHSEPVRILTLTPQTFTKNAKDFSVLAKSHQSFILRMARLKISPWILLCDVGPIPETQPPPLEEFPSLSEAFNNKQTSDSQTSTYLSYLRNLQDKQSNQTALDKFGAGYQDYLQAPLQPLTVNLESVTYEVFEKDPVKYAWYEKATARALNDWIEQGKPTSNPDGRVVVAVVGAGRGPLVTRALKAAEDVGVDIDMWALEKNHNAYVLLQRTNANVWNNQVSLVKSDMRTWSGPVRPAEKEMIKRIYNIEAEDESELSTVDAVAMDTQMNDADGKEVRYRVDILISELLGSFADNELSPECLDGVQHLINPVHGISIPRSYTAHITPIAAPKLHADISLNMTITVPHAAETPYVVMLSAIDFLSTEPIRPKRKADGLDKDGPQPVIKTAWAFQHPNPALPKMNPTLASLPNSHNARTAVMTFPIPDQGICHGLAGYFETVLYPGVELSTNPETMSQKSDGMISWFPIYFPLKAPLVFPAGSEVEVSMWRQTENRKVWYEWLVDVSMLHKTPKGEDIRTRLGGSELHSSEKEACLM